MLRRTVVLALVIALLAPAAAAAQGNDPFSPLPPPPAPTPAPTQPPDDPFGDDLGGSTTLYIIAGALLVVFIGVGVFISRDARRVLPSDSRSQRLREEGPHKHERKAKAKARAKNRRARAARKTTRRAR